MKYLLGEASPEEQQSVTDWIAAEEPNRRYFEQFKLIWDTSRQLAVKSTVDENKAWQRFQNRIKGNELVAVPVKKRNFLWMKVAAFIILVAGVSLIGYMALKPKEQTILAEQATVTNSLPDGSTVTLNKHSSVYYKEKPLGKSRTVQLKGEAFFNVTPDKDKPFIIQANELEVIVVGTSFNVKAQADGVTEVVVETGIVKVATKDKTIELRAGERVRIGGKDSAFAKEEVTDKLYNYYRSKEFVCDNTPLWKFVEVLNEAYDVNIVFGNDRLRNYRLDAPFYNKSLEQVLDVLQEAFPDITITKKDDQIILN